MEQANKQKTSAHFQPFNYLEIHFLLIQPSHTQIQSVWGQIPVLRNGLMAEGDGKILTDVKTTGLSFCSNEGNLSLKSTLSYVISSYIRTHAGANVAFRIRQIYGVYMRTCCISAVFVFYCDAITSIITQKLTEV